MEAARATTGQCWVACNHPWDVIGRAVHLKALAEGSINRVKLPLDERLLDWHHGPLDVIVQADNELQIANLGPEGLSPLVYLQNKQPQSALCSRT